MKLELEDYVEINAEIRRRARRTRRQRTVKLMKKYGLRVVAAEPARAPLPAPARISEIKVQAADFVAAHPGALKVFRAMERALGE